MKIDVETAICTTALILTALGFYCIGRYHEEYLKEKHGHTCNTPEEEAKPETPAATEEQAQ